MSINSVSNNNGDIISVQISIEEWHASTKKYPDIETNLLGFDIPHWQKDEVLKRKKYYEENTNELLTPEEAKKKKKY